MENKPIHSFVVLAYKESPFLENCVKSVTNQIYQSKVIIATTTPNQFIKKIADKYHLKVITGTHTNLGGDFDFAVHSGDTDLVTVAHQDDYYDKDYSKNVIESFMKHPESSIVFTDYYEIRGDNHVYQNALLKIKRILLTPIRTKKSLNSRFFKRLILRFGNSICCPSVTFVIKNCPKDIFKSDFKCNCDWHAWEKLSKQKGAFSYVKKPLMGHRISADSTTTDIINHGIRTKEDYQIFRRFWPTPIAKFLTKLYQKSEKSNTL